VLFPMYIALLSAAVIGMIAMPTKKHTFKTLVLITLLSHGYLTTYATLKEISGYPTNDDLPEEFEIVWAKVEESGDEKFIEIWVKYDTDFHERIYSKFSLARLPSQVSRVHILPYTEENHEFVESTQEKIIAGQKVGVIIEPGQENEEVDLRKSQEQYQIQYENNKISK